MSSAERIRSMAGELRGYTAENLATMIRIPSLSGEEGPVISAKSAMAEGAGFDEVRVDGLGNLIERENLVPDFTVITDATNLGIYEGHRGRMEIDVAFTGLSAGGEASTIYDEAENRLHTSKSLLSLLLGGRP